MTTQPEALRLAEILMSRAAMTTDQRVSTAAELRRLHAQRDALLEALKNLDDFFEIYRPDGHPVSAPHELVRAAIKAAEENA